MQSGVRLWPHGSTRDFHSLEIYSWIRLAPSRAVPAGNSPTCFHRADHDRRHDSLAASLRGHIPLEYSIRQFFNFVKGDFLHPPRRQISASFFIDPQFPFVFPDCMRPKDAAHNKDRPLGELSAERSEREAFPYSNWAYNFAPLAPPAEFFIDCVLHIPRRPAGNRTGNPPPRP